ncbi:MAG: hypothetical protein KC506_03970 [Nanoarchaeota archaeon]|nr:hypothetical protein [Nanoarchaeota archaeon]
MVQKEVIDYVANGRKNGFSDGVLRDKLKEGGYTDSDIDEAMNSSSEKKDENVQNISSSSGGVPWINVSSWIGSVLFFALFIFGVSLIVYPSGANALFDDKVIFLTTFIIGMSGMAFFYSGFIKIGKSLNENKLVLGSWFLIASFFLVLLISIIGNAVGSSSFQVMFTILSMSLSIVFILGVVGQVLFSIGLRKIRREIRFAGLAGIMNWIMVFVFLLFAISFISLSFSMINAMSEIAIRTTSFDFENVFAELGAKSGTVVFFGVMLASYYFMKVLKLVFDVLTLRNGSRRFEQS